MHWFLLNSPFLTLQMNPKLSFLCMPQLQWEISLNDFWIRTCF